MAHPAFERTAHRPWPLPTTKWSWRQTWCDLLFAHWPVPVSVLRPLVPPDLEIQEFDGTSWVGVVPFRMEGVMRRPLPNMPWVSAFPELNVRLYVERDGKPGVWFLSLDATNPLAVWAARRFFFLPYYRAAMSVRVEQEFIHYGSKRAGAEFLGSYRPTSETYLSEPGTLEHFLTERYCLYALSPNGALVRNEVHHVPWPLQRAELRLQTNTMLDFHGIAVSGPPPHLHFARRLEVVVYPGELALPPP
ncbi:MAG TPA: DUF2071 domain-containing protein [Polyangiaceae bacterium]|nr:DUF2071 domain-containing protein [Polyangiaceae bacterium]